MKEGPVPEYLAPGVYVEETSFRSKSIEGVSTSTTAFVGLARKGPVSDDVDTSPTPEILTSYIDFERVFGGFEDLDLGDKTPNYLAHAVNAFFANGGSRLYVARVTGAGAAQASSATFAGSASFKARFPGKAGNGRLVLSLGFAPITERTWPNLPAGTVVRDGGGPLPTPASVTGAQRKRFAVDDGQALVVTIDGTATTATFAGKRASVSGTAAATIAIGASESMTVEVDGEAQTIALAPAGNRPLREVVDEINQKLGGVSVTLDEASSVVTIATDSAGTASTIRVTQAPAGLGLPSTLAPSPPDPVTNNVRNLKDLKLGDVRGVLAALTEPALPNQPVLRVAEIVAPNGDRSLVLSTVATGAVTLAIAGSALEGLGLAGAVVTPAGAGSTPTFRRKAAGEAWPGGSATRQVVSLAITAFDADGHARLFDDLGLDAEHPRFVGKVLPKSPARKAEALENLFYLDGGASMNGKDWAEELVNLSGATPAFARVAGLEDREERVEREISLGGGSDGAEPTSVAYRKALSVLERLDDISIVAAPGYSALPTQADAVELELLTHAEKRRSYRIAVLDARKGQSVGEIRTTKAKTDSKYAALYYPWVVVPNPLFRPGSASEPREISVPPSGFVAGIYARNDVERGVFKAPANEVVRGALRFETDVNFAQQEVLNPLGVNCLRFFPGRGYRVWGSRTTSSDPEWKYVSVRRYFNYLERSIDVGTQWAVFEPNGERLWANVKETISSFLYNEWRSGALLGTDAKEAFFVRCDRSTMDQNDLDNGRLVCLIGVAVVKPAEFVIFRIGQKTADART
jgi:phage tail sheath protein FI